eukprot:1292084-Rhodomonas_salina.2
MQLLYKPIDTDTDDKLTKSCPHGILLERGVKGTQSTLNTHNTSDSKRVDPHTFESQHTFITLHTEEALTTPPTPAPSDSHRLPTTATPQPPLSRTETSRRTSCCTISTHGQRSSAGDAPSRSARGARARPCPLHPKHMTNARGTPPSPPSAGDVYTHTLLPLDACR